MARKLSRFGQAVVDELKKAKKRIKDLEDAAREPEPEPEPGLLDRDLFGDDDDDDPVID